MDVLWGFQRIGIGRLTPPGHTVARICSSSMNDIQRLTSSVVRRTLMDGIERVNRVEKMQRTQRLNWEGFCTSLFISLFDSLLVLFDLLLFDLLRLFLFLPSSHLIHWSIPPLIPLSSA
ncbi:hypothetical protein DFP73DRAFT_595821 [Morchella snyderi]|nr:hypothetical protein DFP73DRAFT_595821 [Morchella snyderi]